MKTCVTCERPVDEWPMAFRGDRACCVVCEKAAAAKDSERTEGTACAR